ncbi:MAG: hypothetical protein KAI24_06590, partial [Planctomycetes bacterium]|nr:hypothetical protein [Planctomycetota bacterium]
MASWRAYLSRSVLLLALLAVASPAQGTPAKPPTEQAGKQAQQPERPADEAALFAMFGELRGMSASYTEKKHLSLLAVPLTSSGRLHFLVDAPPAGERRGKAHLVREVLKPEQSRLTITEAELRMTDGDSTEVIDLRQSDRVRLFVTSLLRIFQGDREALQRHYRVSYVLDPEHRRRWRLELQPKKAPLDKILKRLTLF